MKLSRRKFLHLSAGAAALPTATRFASALDYPTRSVHLIEGFGAGAQPQRGYRHHRGGLKRQLYGQPYMRTDLIKSVRILQLSSRGARWGRSAAYGSVMLTMLIIIAL